MSLTDRWSVELQELRNQGRYRSLRPPAGIDFTTNDYLGYGKRFTNDSSLPISGMASRLLRGHHAIWDDVESALATWHGAEAALMMSSGYAANEGLLATVIEPGDWVATDELNHACILDGLRLVRPRKFAFRHNDLNHLEDGLRAEVERNRSGRERFVVTESLFSMDGDRPDLLAMVELTEKYGAHLIVDEAHATGCYGEDGSGCVDAAGLRQRVLATVHTGGKALGVHGAYIVGSQVLKEWLVNRCRHLIFTTALPPIVGSWWLAMLARVQPDVENRDKLHANNARFRKHLAESGVQAVGTEFVVPVILGDDERAVAVAAQLQARGFDVRAIRPPTVPAGTARLRISVHADHTSAEIDELASALQEAVIS
jgi:8-amino-7-oxononanoate synthase